VLHLAVWTGNFDLVRVLLLEGCSAATMAADGQTPLALAQELCDKQMCVVLLHDPGHQQTTIDLDTTVLDKASIAPDSELSAGDMSPSKHFRHTAIRPTM